MRPWLRRSLFVLAGLLLVLVGVAIWLLRSFDGERIKRVAVEWMHTHHARELTFDGPLTLQLWPQPALTVQGVRLSEPGQPAQHFASIENAALTLHMEPLLARREIDIDRISARGLQLTLRRNADGRRNIDDLLARMASGDAQRAGKPATIEHIELADLQLLVADAVAGVNGRLAIEQLTLGNFGAREPSPLHLQAKAELTQPLLSAAVVLDAGLELLPSTAPGTPPIVLLHKAGLQLRGQGFDFEDLDAQLQADTINFGYGEGVGIGDSRADLEGVQVKFSGKRLGWQVDAGQLGLSRLHLDVARRTLELDRLALQLKGREGDTTLDAQLAWPALKVVGKNLQGGPLEGRVVLGGDQRLQLQLSSQAPSGQFERITVPALKVEIDGQAGSSAVKGHGQATLVLEPKPFAAALDALSLALRFDDPALPRMQVALDGRARASATAASGSVNGTINDQRFEARLDAQLDRPRPFVDVDANFATFDMNRFATPASRGAAPAPAAAATPVDLQALQWADAQLRVRVARLLRAPYRIDALDLQGNITNGVLDLRRLTGRAWGGRFDASGSANAGNGQVALRLRANDVDLRAMLADTTGFDGLRGRGRIDADVRSRGATVGALRAALNGRAELALRPAAIGGIDLAQTLRGWRTMPEGASTTLSGDTHRQTEFSQLSGSFDIRNGVGHNSDLDGQSDYLRLTGEGSIDLAQGRMDYRLRARVVNTATGRAGPEMVMLNGVTVPVGLQGPFGNLQWQVNWPSVTAGVAVRAVPNVAAGTVGTVTRGATGVLRGAAGLLRGPPAGPAAPPPR
jgi:AsmA protein